MEPCVGNADLAGAGAGAEAVSGGGAMTIEQLDAVVSEEFTARIDHLCGEVERACGSRGAHDEAGSGVKGQAGWQTTGRCGNA